MKYTAAYWINRLRLEKHPEGGYFSEIHRTAEKIKGEHLPPRFGGDRHFSTAIYFLLEGNDVSAFHRLQQDEIWHHYQGTEIKIYIIHQDGRLETRLLGISEDHSVQPVAIIPHNTWFAAELINKNSYALIGCTVSPGFSFEDFELGKESELIRQYPDHAELVRMLTF